MDCGIPSEARQHRKAGEAGLPAQDKQRPYVDVEKDAAERLEGYLREAEDKRKELVQVRKVPPARSLRNWAASDAKLSDASARGSCNRLEDKWRAVECADSARGAAGCVAG